MSLRDAVQEVRELGIPRTLYRVGWELRMRTGLAHLGEREPVFRDEGRALDHFIASGVFEDANRVREVMEPRIDPAAREALCAIADDALDGRILCFGKWIGDYGWPIDWYRNPKTGARWPATSHWSEALKATDAHGDIKLAWEAARFPQAYHLARAATFYPEAAPRYFAGFTAMVRSFLAAAPYPNGIHWASSQECVIRLVAWLFAVNAFATLGYRDIALEQEVVRHAAVVGHHIAREIGYARHAVYNNHLITEAVGLVICADIARDHPDARAWSTLGEQILTEQATAQIYEDGAYINQSHNYYRVVAQEYLFVWRWFATMRRRSLPFSFRRPPSEFWHVLMNSFGFLHGHQNPADGRLPNFGANDGSLPRVLSTCDFSDFRPLIQALTLEYCGVEAYEAGPWDEEAAWIIGVEKIARPLRRTLVWPSISLAATGYHVLRGDDRSCFACFRCGSVRDRFGQIDMLHVDLWWRGENVLVDGGTYLYSGPEEWHAHFLRTASHNTVTVDGRDQMLHHRRFKFLYWTRAALLAWRAEPSFTLAVGEHHGYARHPGGVVHRRSVLRAHDDLWIVADALVGTGTHAARLHWLCGEFDVAATQDSATLRTAKGDLALAVYNERGDAQSLDLAKGQETPPRGWLSRYFGEKVPVTSIAQESTSALPWTRVTVVSAGPAKVTVDGERWRVETPAAQSYFTLREGVITPTEGP